MTYSHAVILGVVQGVTEFLPISSSGHLVFVPVFFGWADHGVGFDVMVHLGSLLAVVWYFRSRLWRLITAWKSRGEGLACTADQRLGKLLLLSTIPAIILGGLIDVVLGLELRSVQLVAGSLIFWGVVLAIVDYYQGKKNGKALSDHTAQSALFTGLAQALALIPGTSRSGITMTAGLALGFSKTAAAEFSFLMSVPIILLAGGLSMLKVVLGEPLGVPALPLAVGFSSAAVSGYVAISLLMSLVKRVGFWPFAIYRVLVGVLILVLLR